MSTRLSRRAFLTRSAVIGCSLAASPLVTPVTWAATPGEKRLVVIILRGGMDGLGVLMPHGDPDFVSARGTVTLGGKDGAVDLDGFFAMHTALSPLLPLWAAGQLGFVHAVSTPYRDKRSHFDGQDLLEAGIADLSSGLTRDGWLNRMLGEMPGVSTRTAYALGREPMFVLSGAAPFSRWTPEVDLALSPQALRLAELVMQDDPAFAEAMAQAFVNADSDGDPVAFSGDTADMMDMLRADMATGRQAPAAERIAAFAAQQLRGDARIATFSLNGWDTHDAQDRALPRALAQLVTALTTLRDTMGDGAWRNTAVIAMTEFGRTVRMNGTGGTDHGTGGAMVLAGGAIRGGRVFGEWPGLAEADLYARRDLMPTRDVRAIAGWLIHGLFGLPVGAIETRVFPGVDLGSDPGLLA
ncbi:DUF1501 domain-containing protein [Thalassococcus sp. CAU 1522]|uniref:DUF1501 domain-containing protein n=1 Tax=Thalassococcus arenae TaxID=2851652 RepID=A0ABS6N6M2_9RHOB|nr:DUF1501 domain-containing protein [Thalassococcus arenae]MBV2359665.1 DUF1501 domain-containing protein [Thalassococcus arenae]